MTIKRKRIYEIALIACCCVIIALTAYMGITAMQKSMKLKMSFEVNPSYECRIDYNGDTIFCNTTKNGENLVVGEGVSLNGNNLTLNQNFSGLGAEFALTIHNYTTSKVAISVSGTGANGNTLILDAYTSSVAPNGDITITASGSSATLTFGEYVGFTLTYNANGGSGSMSGSEYPLGVSNALTANTFTMPQTENHSVGIFAGWNTQADGSGITYSDEEIILITENTTLYAMWDYVWIIKQYDGTNTEAWGEYYCVEFGKYPQSLVTGISPSATNETYTYGDNTFAIYEDANGKYATVNGGSDYYKFEPIRWIILATSSDLTDTTKYGEGANNHADMPSSGKQLLLFSEFGLYRDYFDKDESYMNQFGNVDCDVQVSLNNDFADMAGLKQYFASSATGNYISKVSMDTACRPDTITSSHNMFLLADSVGDYDDTYIVFNYMDAYSEQVQCVPTAFAQVTGVDYDSYDNACLWWLRSGNISISDESNMWVSIVTPGGFVSSLDRYVYFNDLAARPCLVFNLP